LTHHTNSRAPRRTDRTLESMRAIMERTQSQQYIDKVVFAASRTEGLSEPLVDLLRHMFVIKPEDRYTMEQVCTSVLCDGNADAVEP
jgi:hypothetical protein